MCGTPFSDFQHSAAVPGAMSRALTIRPEGQRVHNLRIGEIADGHPLWNRCKYRGPLTAGYSFRAKYRTGRQTQISARWGQSIPGAAVELFVDGQQVHRRKIGRGIPLFSVSTRFLVRSIRWRCAADRNTRSVKHWITRMQAGVQAAVMGGRLHGPLPHSLRPRPECVPPSQDSHLPYSLSL